MDFVVVGFGLGALLVLLGLAVRGLGPRLRRTPAGAPMLEVARRVAFGRGCRAAGLALAVSGGFLCGVTFVGLVATRSDAAGAQVVLAGILAVVAGMTVWAGLYLRHHVALVTRAGLGREGIGWSGALPASKRWMNLPGRGAATEPIGVTGGAVSPRPTLTTEPARFEISREPDGAPDGRPTELARVDVGGELGRRAQA